MYEITVKYGGSYFMGTLVKEDDGKVCVIPQRSCGCIPGLLFGVAMWVEKSAVSYR